MIRFLAPQRPVFLSRAFGPSHVAGRVLSLAFVVAALTSVTACEGGPKEGQEAEYWGKKAVEGEAKDREVAIDHLMELKDTKSLPSLYDVLRGEAAYGRVLHRAATVLDDDGLPAEFTDVRQGLDEDRRLLDVLLHLGSLWGDGFQCGSGGLR